MKYKLAHPLAWRLMDGQVFAITRDGMLHVLEEPTAAFLFLELAKAETDSQALLERLLGEFDVPQHQALADLDAFLQDLEAKKIIEK